jgi:hypothetical protein
MRLFKRSAIFSAVFVTLLGCATLSVVVPASASAANAAPIKNYNSGLCLGVATTGKVGQYTCTGNSNQLWYPVVTSDPYWMYIENQNGDCLSAGQWAQGQQIVASSKYCGDNGTSVWQWLSQACLQSNSSACNFVFQKITTYALVMGVDAASKSSGAHAILWKENDTPNQYWTWAAAP